MEFIELIIASSGSATFIASTVYILLKSYKKEIDGRLDAIVKDIADLQNDIKERIDIYNSRNTEMKIQIAKMSSAIDLLMGHRNATKNLDD
jgi:hypothetical protein